MCGSEIMLVGLNEDGDTTLLLEFIGSCGFFALRLDAHKVYFFEKITQSIPLLVWAHIKKT